MSNTVKLTGKMPADFEANGLDSLADVLVEHPEQVRAGFVWFDVQKITDDTDTGSRVPTVRIRRFEPLGDVDNVSQALRDMVQEAVEKRTGRTPLPFDQIEAATSEAVE